MEFSSSSSQTAFRSSSIPSTIPPEYAPSWNGVSRSSKIPPKPYRNSTVLGRSIPVSLLVFKKMKSPTRRVIEKLNTYSDGHDLFKYIALSNNLRFLSHFGFSQPETPLESVDDNPSL